jgi:hypothetical protein
MSSTSSVFLAFDRIERGDGREREMPSELLWHSPSKRERSPRFEWDDKTEEKEKHLRNKKDRGGSI